MVGGEGKKRGGPHPRDVGEIGKGNIQTGREGTGGHRRMLARVRHGMEGGGTGMETETGRGKGPSEGQTFDFPVRGLQNLSYIERQ